MEIDVVSAPNGGLLLINYHYVRDAEYPHPGIYPIGPNAFRQQVRDLTDQLRAATPEEVEAFGRGEWTFEKPAVFFTFDDGLVDHLLVAALLNDQNVKGAFFVSSRPLVEGRPLAVHKVHWLRATTPPAAFRSEFLGMIDHGEMPPIGAAMKHNARATYVYDTPEDAELKYLMNFVLQPEAVDRVTERMLAARGVTNAEFCREFYILNPAEFRALASAGHVIGCHGHSHLPFTSLPEDRLAEEINCCIACLTDVSGRRPNWVSYPYGSPTAVPADPHRFCQDFGFAIGLTLTRDWNHPGQASAALNRINTNEVHRYLSF